MPAPTIEELSHGIAALARAIGRPVRLMEVCGTHTVAIFRHGIRALLPGSIQLLSGPGCPVCVTAAADVEAAILLASGGAATLATFGDMMRVPGRSESLAEARAAGADVRIVYSPLDALALAAKNPSREVVFFATGFETTSPLVAGTIKEAERRGVANFSIFSVHKTVPPALAALLGSGEVQVDGFILPGHVCTVTGTAPFDFLPARFGKAAVVTGFDAGDILSGIAMLLAQLAAGRPRVEIQYTSVVRPEGNPRAREILGAVLRAGGRALAGHRHHPGQRPGAAPGLRPPRRRAQVRARAARGPRPRGLPVRRRAQGDQVPAGLQALREGLHPGPADRRLHGEQRGQLRRLLQVPGNG